MRPSDTTAEAHAVQMAVFRSMTGEQRVLAAMSMADEAREISMEGIRARQPHLDDEGVRLAYLRLLYGDEFIEQIEARR